MSLSNLAYSRISYKSFSRSARHLLQLIAGHQNLQTGWAYLSYLCLSEESGLTRRRVIQLVALLEAKGALEVRRGHGRGHVNFYRILREEDGQPVPHKREQKVKSATSPESEKVKFWAPPDSQKVKSQTSKGLELLKNMAYKVVNTKERKDKEQMPVDQVPQQREVKDEWLTPQQAVEFGLTPGSRLYRQAIGELIRGNNIIFP